jgi:hypothetical protein
MDYEPVIKRALLDTQDLLWAAVAPTGILADNTLEAIDSVVQSPDVQLALSHSEDTALLFYLRAVNLVLTNRSAKPEDTVGRLWPILDHPHLNDLLGVSRDSRLTRGKKKSNTTD